MRGNGVQDTSRQAYEVINAGGRGPAVIVCEHASAHIPERYAGLGLDDGARQSHAAWDPGAEALARLLSEALDAPLIAGRVSRLVYDCNRPPDAPSAMPAQSETVMIPGNADLDEAARETRIREVYEPFSEALTSLIAARRESGDEIALVTVHSFTPTWFGVPRAVEIGIVHDEDRRLSDAMLIEAHRFPHRRIARNLPYGPAEGVTHTLQRHGVAEGLFNVMIEVRNDLLTTPDDIEAIAEELMGLLGPALSHVGLWEGSDA
ncbi:N-formylglutamate amidohydrolase [Salipiger sp.]|uniref:N-formylglutamate amidohydrolase n=1 Tax=Salipiger sp. TaxID=2078585 RepID=UPI003A96EB55